MSNTHENTIAGITYDIESRLQTLDHDLAARYKGYLASAIYIASAEAPDSVFALSHKGGDQAHFLRADQRVYRRILNGEQSAAAKHFESDGTVFSNSLMFPDEHLCLQVPLSMTTDRLKRASLQVVFDKKAALGSQHDVASNLTNNAALNSANRRLKDLFCAAGTKRDDLLSAKTPYSPQHIIIYCDLSSFVNNSKIHGYERAHNFAAAFCSEYLGEMAIKHGAELLRMEGDGAWLSLPIDFQGDHNVQISQIKAAQKMAQDITRNFALFAAKTDKAFAQMKVKIIMEVGEIAPLYWAQNKEDVADHSGPVFSDMRSAEKEIAPDDKNHAIIMGPSLRKIRDFGDTAYSHEAPYCTLKP